MDGVQATRVRLVVLGCGTVGRALIQLVKRSPRADVYALCDSKYMAMAPEGAYAMDEEALSVISDAKKNRKSFVEAKDVVGDQGFRLDTVENGMRKLMQSMSMERSAGGSGFVVADCTATKETSHVLLDALQSGAGIALANKIPVAGDQSLYDALMRYDARVRCESTVLAGTPAVAALRRIVMAEDQVKCLAGAFSGTLGYVCDGLERGLMLSQVVKGAMQAGYTEPDPRDDLGGMDVARKALILARHMRWKIELTDVEVESLFPDHMAQDKMGVEEFVAGMSEMDEGMRKKAAEADAAGKVLRYVATVEGNCCRVGLQAVPKESPLGRLKGTDNLLEIHSEFYDPEPLVIQGRGAGPEITAAGVLADAVEIASTF
uniref:Homoserine dehydrogenase n=1 Tax=Picocystis salinarum TaxID=88271 RepID=A0A7S3UDD7_9CHLO